MQEFYLHAWADNNVKKVLKKINSCIEKNKKCRLWILCAEEYEYISVNDYKLSRFVFKTSLVETILILGVLEHTYLEKYTKQGVKVILWTTFWFFNSVRLASLKNISSKKDIKNLFICMNNVAHDHRIKTIDCLVKNDLLKHGLISWHRNTNKFKYWNEEITTLPSEKNEFFQSILPKELNSCLVNVITESTTEDYLIDVSEKTIHAILAGLPFIIIGCPGLHRKLEELGFKLYTELFNYDFDNIKDDNERIENIVFQLKKLKDKNYNVLFDRVKDKVIRNRQNLFRIIEKDTGVPQEIYKFPVYEEIIRESKLSTKLIKKGV